MPIHKAKNEDFFKIWTSDMAYVLGFFAADGSMSRNKRGGHYIEFQITDGDLLEKIRTLLWSNNKITIRDRGLNGKPIYRLQIGGKSIFENFLYSLKKQLRIFIGTNGGSLYYSRAFRLQYASFDSLKIYQFMYRDKGDMYLPRKKKTFDSFVKNL